jgi:hypothetical protein
MKYMTKERNEKEISRFIMDLEVIEKNEKNTEEIFQEQYIKTMNKMMKKLSENYDEEVFESFFKGCLSIAKHFFDKKTLSKVSDIRLLALGKVFEEEYDFIEKEIVEKDAHQAYSRYFKTIENELPSRIKNNLGLHDCIVTDIIRNNDKLIIEVDSSGGFVNIKNIVFEDYEILEEELDFIRGLFMCEEIYVDNNQYELHTLIYVPKKNRFGYFTIKAQNIIFQ